MIKILFSLKQKTLRYAGRTYLLNLTLEIVVEYTYDAKNDNNIPARAEMTSPSVLLNLMHLYWKLSCHDTQSTFYVI